MGIRYESQAQPKKDEGIRHQPDFSGPPSQHDDRPKYQGNHGLQMREMRIYGKIHGRLTAGEVFQASIISLFEGAVSK